MSDCGVMGRCDAWCGGRRGGEASRDRMQTADHVTACCLWAMEEALNHRLPAGRSWRHYTPHRLRGLCLASHLLHTHSLYGFLVLLITSQRL